MEGEADGRGGSTATTLGREVRQEASRTIKLRIAEVRLVTTTHAVYTNASWRVDRTSIP